MAFDSWQTEIPSCPQELSDQIRTVPSVAESWYVWMFTSAPSA
jgi:hypothetical protein